MFSVLYFICPHTQQTLSYFLLSFLCFVRLIYSACFLSYFIIFCSSDIKRLLYSTLLNYTMKLVMTCFAMTISKTVKKNSKCGGC